MLVLSKTAVVSAVWWKHVSGKDSCKEEKLSSNIVLQYCSVTKRWFCKIESSERIDPDYWSL